MKKGVAIILAVLVADQLSKLWIAGLFAEGRRVIEITSFFNIVEVWNPGVSFGMGAALGPWVLTGLAVVISVALFIWLLRAETGLLQIALSLLIGGAVGNVIDRVRFGAVYDFLDFHAFGYHWPAFNLADTAIFIGVALLLLDRIFASADGKQ